jgi:signal transduction histidine kinase/DNA-binding response OmpR family regulator
MDGFTPQENRRVVWIVDDDKIALAVAKNVLATQGFQVVTFSDPADAMEAMVGGVPDIIVLDVNMPGLDGFEFCSQLRESDIAADVPVLMATSLDDPGSINRAYAAGATDFATKPLNWAIESHRLLYMLRSAETAKLLKAREQETRLAKEDWERTFNSFSDVVTLLSPDLKIIRANSATVSALQKPLENIIGAHCYQMFADSGTPCPNCPVLRTIQTEESASSEQRYRNPGADFLVSSAPVTDKDGRLLHVVHLARDMTEQKQLESEYRHAQKMEAVGTLAGGIAHDFNNLLTVISGYAELLKNDREAAKQNREFAETVFQTAQRGATLAGQLLTFSRKGMDENKKSRLQINDVVGDLRKMLDRVLPKNITVHIRLAGDLSAVNASADQLHQVLMNLAVNASHAMTKGGSLTIETSNIRVDPDYCRFHPEFQPGNFVLIALSDTGHGMDKQTMRRIYEPFFTTKKTGEGTGLGLAVVYGIVKDHGGNILCYSEVGVGTTFKIYLPALQSANEAASAQFENKAAPRGGTETIMIVDDEAHIRHLVRGVLTKLGYTVILAGDGESALLRLREEENRIRLVLLDLGMLGMGGWECLKRMRAMDPKLPVVITTGYAGENLSERARQEGAIDLIRKPYQMDVLCLRLRQILDG